MNVNKYIGIPYKANSSGFDGADCWGLVRLVIRNEFNRDLPEFLYTENNQINAINRGFEELRPDRVLFAYEGCIILLLLRGLPIHVGICIDEHRMLHTLAQHDSAVERFDSIRWCNRVEGVYDVG